MGACWNFINEMAFRFKRDDVDGLSAQLAYYFLLSIFPFFVFSFTMLAYFPFSTTNILSFINEVTPGNIAELLESTLHQFMNVKRGWLLFISLLGTLWSASTAVHVLFIALDRAHDAKEDRPYWLARGISILFTIGMVIAILITLVLPVFGQAIQVFATTYFFIPKDLLFLWNLLRWIFSLLFLIILFASLYYFAPNKKVCLVRALVSATFTAIGWLTVSFAFSFYVNNFNNYSITYGSLGGVIVLMIWFYLSAMIILLGGQINAILNKKKIDPHEK